LLKLNDSANYLVLTMVSFQMRWERGSCSISLILIPMSTEVYFYLKCQPMPRHVPMTRVS